MATAISRDFDFDFPHNNQGLFSNYYLDTLLPKDEIAWNAVSESDLLAVYSQLKDILEELGLESLAGLNESGLEEHFIKPALKSLGWEGSYDVQVRQKVIGPLQDQPDYAFFPSHESMVDALPNRENNTEAYLKKAVAVGDAKAWDVDLDKGPKTAKSFRKSPSFQINQYILHTELPWGILTNGHTWRLYHKSYRRQLTVFYEINLLKHLQREFDPAMFRYFALFFSRSSFIPREAGKPVFLEQALAGSTDYSKAVENNLKKRAFEVVEILINGLINANPQLKSDPESHLESVSEAALILLYRLLFILYAEPRGLLPLAENEAYRQRYSLDALKHQIKSDFDRDIHPVSDDFRIYNQLHALFRRIETGSEELDIFAYNGGLFLTGRTPLLDSVNAVSDVYLENALLLLTTDEAEDGRYGDFIDYRSLSVQHLGSIYEGLLELKPSWAAEDMTVISGRNKAEFVLPSKVVEKHPSQYTPVTERIDGKQLPKTIPACRAYLRTDKGERKGSGTYYTPHRIVEFIVETSLAPLCDGKTREKILRLKVLDPAMGSAHFLVGAVDYLAGQIMAAESEGEEGSAIGSVDDARRIVVERCIFGVDINPLAVELAKLSLWLHTIRRDRALNFLDHHLKTGNSLIGATIAGMAVEPGKKKKKMVGGELQHLFLVKLKVHLKKVLDFRRQIERLPSDTAEQVATKKRLLDESDDALSRFKLYADLYTSFHFGVQDANGVFAAAAYNLDDSDYWREAAKEAPFADAVVQRDKHRFFHWELEFPEVFFDDSGNPLEEEKAGFDAVVGNPPWDVVKPQSRWFFINHDPLFRELTKQQAIKRMKELCEDPEIVASWDDFQETHKKLSAYFKDQQNYSLQYRGDINLYKLFAERMYQLLKESGHSGVVLPTGIYTDLGSKLLRENLLENTSISHLLAFSNERFMFRDVDHRYKFCVLTFEKGPETDSFRASFIFDPRIALREEDLPQFLGELESNTILYDARNVRRFSPDSLSFMEFNSQKDIDITEKIYDDHPLLGDEIKDAWNVKFTTEFHMTNDSHLFNESRWGYPLLEGKSFYLYSIVNDLVRYWVSESEARGNSKCKLNDVLLCDRYNIVFRDISYHTNERTLVSTIIPKKYIASHLVSFAIVNGVNYEIDMLYLLSIFNSLLMDFLTRQKVSGHLSYYYMEQLPVPRKINKKEFVELVSRATSLVCTESVYSDLWSSVFEESWNELGIYEGKLEREWRPEFGADDFTEDRRDGPQRAKLRAEIDAIVAHLYGLTREEFAYILDTFPVLKKYDIRDFGHFRSKDWALAAYDDFAERTKRWKREQD